MITHQLSQGTFAPAVIGQTGCLKQLRIFFLTGKVIIQITLHLVRYKSALAVHGFHNIRNTVFFQYVLQPKGNHAVSCQCYGIGRFILPKITDGLFRRDKAAQDLTPLHIVKGIKTFDLRTKLCFIISVLFLQNSPPQLPVTVTAEVFHASNSLSASSAAFQCTFQHLLDQCHKPFAHCPDPFPFCRFPAPSPVESQRCPLPAPAPQ